MDGRTFSTSRWILWSSKVGLCENIGKSQVTARSLKQKNLLPDFFTPDLIVSDILFLGITSRSTRRENSAKEKQRLKAANATISILAGLKLSSQVVSSYARIFGLSKCTYGWIARLPTWTDCKKL